MRFDAVIELGKATHTKDSIGQQVASTAWRPVYANEYAVSAREFYDAGAQGHKAERQYQIRAIEYADEKLARVDGVEYNIIRPQKRGEWTLLTLERVIANG